MKRALDVVLATLGLALMALPLALIGLAVRRTSPGPALYWSKRVGRANQLFSMPKFRTMRVDAPVVATHLLNEPERWLTPIGHWLRRTSLDEVPQLWSVLVGHMSLVGPRPALFNQHDLMALRSEFGVDGLRPGLTGWAQVNGRDELPIPLKVELDAWYLRHQSLALDLRILLLTLVRVARQQDVAH